MASSYTCTACASTFDSSADQRAHYKLDWHRYNLKRKVAGLAPVTREDFDRRVAAIAGSTAPKPAYRGKCTYCRKTFASEQQYQQHLETRKHQQAVAAVAGKPEGTAAAAAAAARQPSAGGGGGAAAEDDALPPPPAAAAAAGAAAQRRAEGAADASPPLPPAAAATATADAMEDEDEYDNEEDAGPPVALGPDVCIFCNRDFAGDARANVDHMRRAHGFFVPDADYLIDLEGLLTYCSEKVKLGCICLVCNGRGRAFHTWRAVQQHMADVGHCRLLYEEGEDLHEFEPFYDFRPSYAAAGAAAGGASGGDGAAPMDEDGGDDSLAGVRRIEVTHLGELQLLDGRVVGHRQYDRYYRQAPPRADNRASTAAARRELELLGYGGGDGGGAASGGGGGQLATVGGGGGGSLAARAAALGSGGASARELRRLRRAEWLAKREALKVAIRQNKLNRTFTRVFEC